MAKIEVNDIVTVQFFEAPARASNTYIVAEKIEREGAESAVLLKHPLHPEARLLRPESTLNKVSANSKDSTERSLEFAAKYEKYLDYDSRAELEALNLYFFYHRNLSRKQKGTLGNICGVIASIYFNNDIAQTMKYIEDHKAVLDAFNNMWFVNFKDLFNGTTPITSVKQRSAIFNIAGFVLAEMESQKTLKQ